MGNCQGPAPCHKNVLTCNDQNFLIGDLKSNLPDPSYARPVDQVMNLRPKVQRIYAEHSLHYSPAAAFDSCASQRDSQSDLKASKNKKQYYYIFSLCAYYEGGWKDGLPEGIGRLFSDNGVVYQGEFKKGKPTSQNGLIVYPYGAYYKGGVLDGVPSGKGLFYNEDVTYQGQWNQGLPHGTGKQIFKNGMIYEGNFHKGKKHGTGIFNWDSDTFYCGRFEHGTLAGYGTLNCPDFQYHGQFKNGVRHGSGKQIYDSKGNYYVGNFDKDQRSGFGVFQFRESGLRVSGQFTQGKMKVLNSVFMEEDATMKTEHKYTLEDTQMEKSMKFDTQ